MKSFLPNNFISKSSTAKIALILAVFVITFIVFKSFQNPTFFNATLKNVTYTYLRYPTQPNLAYKISEPYTKIDSIHSSRWDGAIYNEIVNKYYSGADHKYAFFPLFPMLWKASHIPVEYIGLFNYLFFGLAVLLFSIIFLNSNAYSRNDKLMVFLISLTLPAGVVYYLPYAEGLFTFSFALALYGLSQKKYWIYFVGILLFALARPIFMVVGVSFICVDILYFLKHRNLKHFIKEFILKILPLLLGTFIVFFMFYLNSGSFTKYFEVLKTFWKVSFTIPEKISDWSTEGFGMNVFTFFFIIIPVFIFLCYNLLKLIKRTPTPTIPSIFNGNSDFIKEYFFNMSVFYFGGVFVFTFFYQYGSLNGLSRYIIGSPFMLICIYYAFENIKALSFRKIVRICFPLLILSIYFITSVIKLEPHINFNDSGFFTLFLSFLLFISWKSMNAILRYCFLFFVVFYNVLWITYLYNVYLCNGYIYT